MERADELALLMTLEMGKALAESKSEIVYAADFFRWHSGDALRLDGDYKQFGNGTSRVLTMKQPVGPVPDDHARGTSRWRWARARWARRSPPAARS